MNNLRPLLCFSEKTNWWCYPNRFSCKFKNIFDCQITYERIINEPKITSGPNFSLMFWGEKWSNFLTSNCEVKSSILLGHCVLKNELSWVLQQRWQNHLTCFNLIYSFSFSVNNSIYLSNYQKGMYLVEIFKFLKFWVRPFTSSVQSQSSQVESSRFLVKST